MATQKVQSMAQLVEARVAAVLAERAQAAFPQTITAPAAAPAPVLPAGIRKLAPTPAAAARAPKAERDLSTLQLIQTSFKGKDGFDVFMVGAYFPDQLATLEANPKAYVRPYAQLGAKVVTGFVQAAVRAGIR